MDMGIGHLLHAHAAGLLQHVLVDERHVLHIDTQPRDAVVDVDDIVNAAQAFDDIGKLRRHDSFGHLCLVCHLGRIIRCIDRDVLCREVLVEHEVVGTEVHRTERNDHVPLRAWLQDAPDEEVDDAATCATDGDAEHMRQHEGKARHHGVEGVEHRCHKQERELERLGDAGDEGRHSAGDHKRLDAVTLVLGRGAVDGKGSSGKAEEHECELALCKIAGVIGQGCGAHGVDILVEDVEAAFCPVEHTADGSRTEELVDDVVQAGRDEATLSQAKEEDTEVAKVRNRCAQRHDGNRERKPNEGRENAQDEHRDEDDDSDRALAAVEGDGNRKLRIDEAVMQGSCKAAYQNASEGGHVRCTFDAEHGCRIERAEIEQTALDHRRTRSDECVIADKAGECRDLLVLPCKAESKADGKQHRNLCVDRVCDRFDRSKDKSDRRRWRKSRHGCNDCILRQCTHDTQKQADRRERCNRQHQALAKFREVIHDTASLILLSHVSPLSHMSPVIGMKPAASQHAGRSVCARCLPPSLTQTASHVV